jgi:hypothetical protein
VRRMQSNACETGHMKHMRMSIKRQRALAGC